MAPVVTRAQKKERYYAKVCHLLENYNKAFIVHADNVASKQFMDIRAGLRPMGASIILMGKNTMMKRCIRNYMQETGDEKWSILLEQLVGNVGLVFTKAELTDVRDKMDEYRVGAPARANVVAPVSVTVPGGPTGMDPSQTSFFQTLNIATKINKGSIDILNDTVVFNAGEKVSASAAILLAKLKIKPFTYGLIVLNVVEGGAIFPPAVLDLSDDDIQKGFMAGLGQVAALSLGLGIPNDVSLPHMILNGFKNVVAIGLEIDYPGIKQVDKIKEILANPEAFAAMAAAAAPAAGGGGGAAAAKAPEPEPEEEEEEEDMGFDLFD